MTRWHSQGPGCSKRGKHSTPWASGKHSQKTCSTWSLVVSIECTGSREKRIISAGASEGRQDYDGYRRLSRRPRAGGRKGECREEERKGGGREGAQLGHQEESCAQCYIVSGSLPEASSECLLPPGPWGTGTRGFQFLCGRCLGFGALPRGPIGAPWGPPLLP